MVFNIGTFLERFRHITPKDESLKKIIAQCITENIGVSLETRNIQIQGKTVFVNTAPPVKSQIFIYKKILLECVNTVIEKERISDIR